jgi:L-ascorbate metabolism protein UlaG (beta-lactamase superfamily)
MPQLKGSTITWLGHATVLVTTAKGTNILIDPFIIHNPVYPKGYELPEKIDLLLLTHGHMDHIADAVPVAKKYSPTIVAVVELAGWIRSKDVQNIVEMNLGGTYKYKDVSITMVEAKHTSGIEDGDKVIYGGTPVGYVLTVENGPILYHAGDTSLFSDMQLIRELYTPELAMLPIGDHFTMGPKAASIAAKYLGVNAVLPLHFGTFPVLTGTPQELEQHLKGSSIEVLKPAPGSLVK